MAIVPKHYATGIVNNNSEFSPLPNSKVPTTNHTSISNVPLDYSSTIEFKGYYRATQTGDHTFSLTSDSVGVTGYSWVSGAPRTSSRIKGEKPDEATKTLNITNYGIIIPPSRGNYWPWEDPNVLGTAFPGYGYWPARGYGNKTAWRKIFRDPVSQINGKNSRPDTKCGFTEANGYNVDHEWFLPGDIRQYADNFGQYEGYHAGPGWQGPEDPNFNNPCYVDGTSEYPLVNLRNSDEVGEPGETSYVPGTLPTTTGRTAQVYLGWSNVAEGQGNTSKLEFVDVDTSGSDANASYSFVWPQAVSAFADTQGVKVCERMRIGFSILFKRETDTYTFEWRSRDGLKIWYKLNTAGVKSKPGNFIYKFPDDVAGINPCNRDSTNTARTGWRPGGGELPGEPGIAGFTGSMEIEKNQYIRFEGYAVGRPDQDEHGWSLVIKASDGTIIWTTAELMENNNDLIGIDECGYNALLSDEQRINENRDSESFTQDGWQQYGAGGAFYADINRGDLEVRDVLETRQYLPSNSLTRCRGGQSISGTVFLRQNDYYFIRTIVSNHRNENSNYQFRVKGPGGSSADVKFSGNGDGSLDTTVGGSAGSGVPIRTDVLCSSILNGGDAGVSADDINFAFIPRMSVVLNLTALGVTNHQLSSDLQAEYLEGNVVVPGTDPTTLGGGAPGVMLVTGEIDENNEPVKIGVSFVRMLRGGSEGITELTLRQRQAIMYNYTLQRQPQVDPDTGDEGPSLTLEFGQFRNAITSSAVIKWGSAGNYDYLYHGVSDVITSICTGTPIVVPVPPNGKDNSTANTNCLDVDVSVLGGGAAQITTECFDGCKDPDQYPMLENLYKKNSSDYAGMVSGYEAMINVRKDYGMVAPSKYSPAGILERPKAKGSVKEIRVSAAGAQADSVRFPARKITSIPLTIPDVNDDPQVDLLDPEFAYDTLFRFELSSNTFTWDSDDVGGTPEGDAEANANRPLIGMWVSVFPGGPPLGDFGFANYPGRTIKYFGTVSPEVWVDSKFNPESAYKDFIGAYMGNTYGVRWLNIAPMKRLNLRDESFVMPEPGTQEFMDLISVWGVKSNQFRCFIRVPAPDCTIVEGTNPGGTDGNDSSDNSDGGVKTYDERYSYLGDQYRKFNNPYGYGIQDGTGTTLNLKVDKIVGYINDQGTISNKASVPLTVPPVNSLDDWDTNSNSRNYPYGVMEWSSNTFIIDPQAPKDENGFPDQHSSGAYGVIIWVSRYPGGPAFLPGKNYASRAWDLTYYNDLLLIQDERWADDLYTGMPNNSKFNGDSIKGGGSLQVILGQTTRDESEVRFLNFAMVRNDANTFSDYDPSKPYLIAQTLNADPGTAEFQEFVPPMSEAYCTSTRWRVVTKYPRSQNGTIS